MLLLAVSWRRWLSPIADSGRELDLPRRLLEGELLYRDVHYLYGPLAPYLKAFLFSLFGERLDVLQASGIFASLVILLLVYTIAQRLLGRGEAALAVATVTLYCVFKPGGNLISPYSYAALYALVLSLGSLQAMIVYIESGRVGHLLLAGLLTGLAAVTKQEFALASAAAALAAALSVAGRDGRFDMSRVRELTRKLLIFALPALVVVVPVYGFFFSKAGWQTMVEDCHILYTHLPAPMIFYNARRAGLDQPGLSLLQLTGGGMVLALLCGLLLILAEPAIIRRHSAKVALGFLGAIGGIAVIRLIVGTQWDGSPLRFMPVLLALVIIGAWRKDPVRMIVAVFSLALLARV
ncbi:MAG: hypothetical protein EBZ36_18330, partial [Acidobacteria bacterium]|nr:hypothetical protein [Acidobacteriota bacterium]